MMWYYCLCCYYHHVVCLFFSPAHQEEKKETSAGITHQVNILDITVYYIKIAAVKTTIDKIILWIYY